ncbi:MAG: hypothetical protein FD172_3867 [Methylocystaceae bacterium]|nr:MAG: hypothetical protein FD172_3867 [Methylocystaceae bacterium]
MGVGARIDRRLQMFSYATFERAMMTVFDHRQAEWRSIISANPCADARAALRAQCSIPERCAATSASLHLRARNAATARSERTRAGVPSSCGKTRRFPRRRAIPPHRHRRKDVAGKASTLSPTARPRMSSAPSPSTIGSFSRIEVIDEKSNEIPADRRHGPERSRLHARRHALQKDLRDRPRDRQ